LGHHISAEGIEADGSKVEWVLNWQAPTSAKQVHQFLGLVCYISAFLPALAEHTTVLTLLTKKECNTLFPAWTTVHQHTFEAIKGLVLSRDCLTTINHHEPKDNKIFVTCNASKLAFKSRQLKGAELHYPVHEQEMLSIMQALTKWRVDLLGTHINIYTDHKTIENFDGQ
ncbi:DNA/RNA polymerase, partial [Tricholoma matsutake]